MKALILAAGKGKRLRAGENDFVPKAMKTAAGEPLIAHVLRALDFIPPEDITVIVGFGRETLEEFLSGRYPTAVQSEQLGTGHAARCGMDTISPDYSGGILVAAGDMPLVRRETYLALCREHESSGADCTILTAVTDDPFSYGRIKRGADGGFLDIVEQKDCTPEEAAITEINSSIYVFGAEALRSHLAQLRRSNAQGEYYLTDLPRLIAKEGGKVAIYRLTDERELLGVNDPAQLALADEILSERKKSADSQN